MPHQHHIWPSLCAAAVLALTGFNLAQSAPLMIVGNDEKLAFDDNGKPLLSPPGKDSVVILDLADPENPKTVANLPLKNSIVGPPVNLAIDPTGTIALVADSVDIIKDGDALKLAPDNKIYVIDLKANPPKLANTVTVGKQPSGLSFSPAGDLALVANRADKSIGVLAVKGTDVKLIDTIDMGDIVSHVVFTPDGKRALATKFNGHKVSLLDVNGDKVTYSKVDLPTGQWPYNVAVAPSGKIALTSDNGSSGASDGSVDTVSVIDLEAKPPRIIDRVVVGDAPEGLRYFAQGRRRGRSPARRLRQQERLFPSPQRKRGSFAHRRQQGHEGRRGRGRRRPGRRSLHAGWEISADRQLPRSGYLHPEGRRLDHHQHRQALQAPGSPGIGRNEHAIDSRHALCCSPVDIRKLARAALAAGYARTNNNTLERA